jgi:O-antigen ligase
MQLEMKNLLLIQDSLSNKISYYLIVLFVIMLPYERFYDELVVITLLAVTLLNPRKPSLKLFTPQLIMIVSIYIIALLGTFYSAYRPVAYFELEKKLGILIFPFLLTFNKLDLKKYQLNILIIFAISCVATTAYLFLNAFITIILLRLNPTILISSAFMNQNFSLPIELHATYLAMYICTSIGILVYLLAMEEKIKQKFIIWIGLLILISGIIQLSSRAVFIALLVIIIAAVPFLLIRKDLRKKYLIISCGLTVLAILIAFNINTYRERYMVELRADLSNSNQDIDVIEPRVVRWQSAFRLIGQSPVFGFGNGSETPILKEQYFKDKHYDSYLNNLNAHNQYISFLLQEGVIGFMIYVSVLLLGMKRAWIHKNFIFMSFLIIIVIVSFSENILDSNKGVFFFSFFLSLFLIPDNIRFVRTGQ